MKLSQRCRADFHGDAMPDHRGCPAGAECEAADRDIYWQPPDRTELYEGALKIVCALAKLWRGPASQITFISLRAIAMKASDLLEKHRIEP